MKIEIDYDLCECNAVCERLAPELFRVGDDDTLVVLDESPAESWRPKLEAAVEGCPRAAIKIVDEV